jgi:hypothetical protein
MTKENFVDLMLASMNSDNRAICKQGGMAEDEIEKQISQSQTSLLYMLSNAYDKLKSNNLIA